MNSTNKTIVIDDAVPYAKEIFSHLGHVVLLPGKEIKPQDVKHADALIIRSRTNINAELLNDSKVTFVGSTVVGLDHVDQTYLKDNDIEFYSAQGCNANSVAEFIITMLFNISERFEFALTSKTLGIIGVGNVGQKVYDKAQILGIKCLLNDPPKLEKQPGLVNNPDYVDLDTCLQADIITVHTPLTQHDKHPTLDLISADKLANIKPHQIIINAARGGIINEQAWVNTTTQANIIDCWENEPKINPELYQKALIATPHIAGHSLDAKIAGSTMVYQQLCQFWGQTPQTKWQACLPSAPQTISVTKSTNLQQALNEVFSKTHNIEQDDKAIRDENIENIYAKYEDYRRNFPIYREWSQQKLNKTNNQNLNNLLKKLGFTLI